MTLFAICLECDSTHPEFNGLCAACNKDYTPPPCDDTCKCGCQEEDDVQQD